MIAANPYNVCCLLIFCVQWVAAASMLLEGGQRGVRLPTNTVKTAMIVMHVMPAVLE